MQPDLTALSSQMKNLLEELRGVAGQINLRGWAEANAGNISVNIGEIAGELYGRESQWYLVSRGGSRYRQMAYDPLPHLVLVRMDERGEECFPAKARPTSEWICHKLLQRHFREIGSEEKVVLHAHPNSVILLSQMEVYLDERELNKLLRQALAELEIFLPEGVATTSSEPPGSNELAQCSLTAMGRRKALIWQGHGLLCTGKNLNEALDYFEVVEKAATIALKIFHLTKTAL